MTRAAVSGKLLALATTNGTRALLSVNGAAHVYAAAAVNLTVAAARARQAVEEGQGVLVLCAGREGAFALDDAYTAGRFLLKAFGPDPALACNDAARASLVLAGSLGSAWTTVFSRTRAAADLVASDLAADIAVAGTEDAFPVLPELRDRRLTIPAA
jgi:phosphosulfolactate phosphohydrolase-like enzyme